MNDEEWIRDALARAAGPAPSNTSVTERILRRKEFAQSAIRHPRPLGAFATAAAVLVIVLATAGVLHLGNSSHRTSQGTSPGGAYTADSGVAPRPGKTDGLTTFDGRLIDRMKQIARGQGDPTPGSISYWTVNKSRLPSLPELSPGEENVIVAVAKGRFTQSLVAPHVKPRSYDTLVVFVDPKTVKILGWRTILPAHLLRTGDNPVKCQLTAANEYQCEHR